MEHPTYYFQLYDPYFKNWQMEDFPDPDCIRICPNANEAAENADGLLILTAHEFFRKADLNAIRPRMCGHFLFDFFNFVSDQSAITAGLIRITNVD